jgi:predicted RNA-binding protein with PUA-like domain
MATELPRRDHESSPPASPRCWLVKFAPFRTSWTQIVQRGTFTLRGVRSPAARKHLSEMRVGDPVLFYHSQQELAVVGIVEVTREAYPDPTSSNPQWLTCDFAPVKTLAQPVFLDTIKADARLAMLPLIRQPRLAVMPVSREEFETIAEELSASEQDL